MTDQAAPAAEAPTNGASTDPGAQAEAQAVQQSGPDLETLQAKHRDALLQSGRLEQQNRALQAKLEELESKASGFGELEERFKSDPLEALKHFGHTVQAVNDRLIDSETNPETPEQAKMRALEDRIASLTERLEGTTGSIQQEKAQAARQQNLEALSKHIEDSGEELSALHTLGRAEAVLSAIEHSAAERGYDFTPEEIEQTLRESEQTIRGQIKPEIEGLVSLPWGRQLIEDALKQATSEDPQATKDHPAQKQPASKKAPRTISNADASEVASAPADQAKPVSAGERHSRAAARVARRRAERQ